MIRSAWIRDDNAIARVDISIDYEGLCETRSDLWKIYDKFIETFMKRFPYTIIMEVSRIGLCDELDIRSDTLKRDFKILDGETLQHARMRYSFVWCNYMKDIWYPNVKAYSDTEYDTNDGITCNAVSACLLQLLRDKNQLSVLDDIAEFERCYYESVHEQLLEV